MRPYNEPLAWGTIDWLGINRHQSGPSEAVEQYLINLNGIVGDYYYGNTRFLSSHDGGHLEPIGLTKGQPVRNHRKLTALARFEIDAADRELGQTTPPGILRENIVFNIVGTSVGGFSFTKLPPTSRIVIGPTRTVVLWAMELNKPCNGVARPYADYLGDSQLASKFITAFTDRRGQMLDVYAPGTVSVGCQFEILPPVGSR